MKQLNLTQEDYEFLKELQYELNTQPTGRNDKPVFWGIMEDFEVPAPEECGEPKIRFDDGTWTVEEAVEEIKEYLETDGTDEQKLHWERIDHDDPSEIYDYMVNILKWRYIIDVVWVDNIEKLSTYTGAFLTKRACKNYIEKYGYNHNNPRTYAMTAIRNPEFERLINIIKRMSFKENMEE